MREKLQRALPVIFAMLFVVSRWPGLLPPNFSAAYALAFCAGVFFPARRGWRLPLAVMVGADLALNCYYQFVKGYTVFTLGGLLILAGNYVGYAFLYGLGRWLKPTSHYLGLLSGGLIGAALFYLITNSASWLLNPFHNPEYTRDFAGWLRALTFGTAGHPPTWEFFRNTLLSGGLFTALFAGSWKLSAAESPQEKGETKPEGEPAEAEAEGSVVSGQ